MRRYKRLMVTPEEIVAALPHSTPKGAKVVSMSVYPTMDHVVILIEHDSFAPVKSGVTAPLIEIAPKGGSKDAAPKTK